MTVQYWGREFERVPQRFFEILVVAMTKRFRVSNAEARERVCNGINEARYRAKHRLRVSYSVLLSFPTYLQCPISFPLQRHCLRRSKELDAHPVWLMIVRSEMIRFRYKDHLIDLCLPDDTENEAEMDRYAKTFGKKVNKEHKVGCNCHSKVFPR